jgi:2-keto-4-pentenoate hydratase
MNADNAKAAAEVLVGAHRSKRPLDALPEELQAPDMASAYAVQDAIMGMFGPTGGWKTSVGRADDLCSPIPADRFFPSGTTFDSRTWNGPRLEVEIGVRFGRDLPSLQEYSASRILDGIEALVPIIEIATSRFVDRTSVSPFDVVADLQNNEAVVSGKGIADWSTLELAAFQATLTLDGQPCEEAKLRHQHTTQEVLTSLQRLVQRASIRNMPIKSGDVVLLGARLLPVGIRPGVVAKVTVDRVGVVEASF